MMRETRYVELESALISGKTEKENGTVFVDVVRLRDVNKAMTANLVDI